MKIKISLNFYLVFLSLIIAWFSWISLLFTLPTDANNITDILVILFFLVVLFCENMISSIPLNKQFLYFLVITVTSSVAANILFKQPLIKGLLVLRHTYIQYSIALPLYYLIKSGRVKRDQLYYTLIMAIRIAVTVYVVFYLLHTYVGIDILKISGADYQRYGSDRFYLNLDMPFFLLCNAFSNLYAERMKIINYYDIVMVMYLVLKVTKLRYPAFSCVVAILIGLMVAKRFNLKKILLFVGAGCAGAVVLFFTSMGNEFLDMVFGGDFFSAQTETIRKIGRLKHLVSFLKSPVFGLGYPHEDCFASMYEFGTLNAYYISGNEEKIYITDNGIFDLLYIFGLSGVVWLISYFGVWLKKSVRLIKSSNVSVYFIFIVLQIIEMYTGCTWLFFGMIFIGILDALIRSAPEEPERLKGAEG